MTCDSIYDELDNYAYGEHEPYSRCLCFRAIAELGQLLYTIAEQNARIDGLVMENCDLRARLVDANQMIEEKIK